VWRDGEISRTLRTGSIPAVSPLQGLKIMVCIFSQGVALGWHVLPLRGVADDGLLKTRHQNGYREASRPRKTYERKSSQILRASSSSIAINTGRECSLARSGGCFALLVPDTFFDVA
jgi:hypothetical protein